MTILSFNTASKQVQSDEITSVTFKEMMCKVIILFEDGDRVECTPNHLFLTVSGEWKRYEYRKGEVMLRVGDELVSFDGKTQKIKRIEYRDIERQDYYHLCAKNNHNFIVDGGVIAHNMQIDIEHENNDIVRINGDTTMQILALKQAVANQSKIPLKHIKLMYAGKVLDDDKKQLSDYETNFGSGAPTLQVKILNPEQIFGAKDNFALAVQGEY